MPSLLKKLEIRVNEIPATGLRLQRGMVDGYPSGPWEVHVEIPNLGYIELDEKPDFNIEVKDPMIPAKKRVWRKVTLPELISWLQSLGVMEA